MINRDASAGDLAGISASHHHHIGHASRDAGRREAAPAAVHSLVGAPINRRPPCHNGIAAAAAAVTTAAPLGADEPTTNGLLNGALLHQASQQQQGGRAQPAPHHQQRHQMSGLKPEKSGARGEVMLTSGVGAGEIARSEPQSVALASARQQVLGQRRLQRGQPASADGADSKSDDADDDSETRPAGRPAQADPAKSGSEPDSDADSVRLKGGAARPAPVPAGGQQATGAAKLKQPPPDCKTETTDSSPNNHDDERNGGGSDCERRYRPQKYCAVCGDKAIACNFNAVTCESCKAFFRRNAFKEQRLRCLFENCCLIDRVTRRFCSKCRLLKCLQIGMKREWILTDEQKQIKRVKIMQNKQTRQRQQVSLTGAAGRCADDVAESRPSSGTSSCHGGYPQQQPQPGADQLAAEGQYRAAARRPPVDMRDAATSCPDETDLLAGKALPCCSMAHQCQFCSSKLAPPVSAHHQQAAFVAQTPGFSHYQPGSEASFNHPHPHQQPFQHHNHPHHHHHHHHQQQQQQHHQHQQAGSTQASHSHYHYQQAGLQPGAVYSPQGAQPTVNCYGFSAGHPSAEPAMNHHQYHYHHSGANRTIVSAAAAAGPNAAGAHVAPSPDCCCSVPPAASTQAHHIQQTQTQLVRGTFQSIGGVAQANGAQVTFAVDAVASAGPTFISGRLPAPGPAISSVPHLHMVELLQARVQPSTGSAEPDAARGAAPPAASCPEHQAAGGYKDEPAAGGEEIKAPPAGGCGGDCRAADRSSAGGETKISADAKAAECDAPNKHQDWLAPGGPAAGGAKTGYVTWKDELFVEPAWSESEIRARVERNEFSDSERRIIYEMIEATQLIFESNDKTQNDSSLDDIVFFCDLALRRLIKTVKKINAFRMLTMDDQIMLLKNACFKILLIRSSVYYQDEFEGWIDKGGTTLPLKSLKTEKCNNYERHKELLEKLAPPLRRDRLVMAFLILVILFDPTVALKHSNSVNLDNIVYLCTLRKYLLSTQPEPLAKYERLVEVLQLVGACNDEYNLFFSRKYQPEQITPLLIEIFDISVKDPVR